MRSHQKPARLRADRADRWREADLGGLDTLWGGEVAATVVLAVRTTLAMPGGAPPLGVHAHHLLHDLMDCLPQKIGACPALDQSRLCNAWLDLAW